MPRSYRCGNCNKLFLSLGYVLDHSTTCNKVKTITQPITIKEKNINKNNENRNNVQNNNNKINNLIINLPVK